MRTARRRDLSTRTYIFAAMSLFSNNMIIAAICYDPCGTYTRTIAVSCRRLWEKQGNKFPDNQHNSTLIVGYMDVLCFKTIQTFVK